MQLTVDLNSTDDMLAARDLLDKMLREPEVIPYEEAVPEESVPEESVPEEAVRYDALRKAATEKALELIERGRRVVVVETLLECGAKRLPELPDKDLARFLEKLADND